MRHTPAKLLLAFVFLLFTLPSYAAETRGVKRVEIKTQAGESVGLYEESHALVIGMSDYTGGWQDLRGCTCRPWSMIRGIAWNGGSPFLERMKRPSDAAEGVWIFTPCPGLSGA